MASTFPIAENHWRVFMGAQDRCDVIVEVHMPLEQAHQIVSKAKAEPLAGLDVPTPSIPDAVMMKLMS